MPLLMPGDKAQSRSRGFRFGRKQRQDAAEREREKEAGSDAGSRRFAVQFYFHVAPLAETIIPTKVARPASLTTSK